MVLALWLVVTELRRRVGGEKLSVTGGGAVDIEADNIPAPVRARKATRIFAWILGIYLAVWLLGFKLAMLGFLAAYVGIEARAKWTLVLGVTALLATVMFMFQTYLEVFWLEGLLNLWLQEPLPWLF